MNIKTILLTLALLVAFSITTQAQYTVVRVLESYNNKTSEIQIAYENGETDVIKLDKLIATGLGQPFNTDNSMSNIKIITKTLNTIKSKGYKLISSSTSGAGIGDGAAFSIQTYIFEKEE